MACRRLARWSGSRTTRGRRSRKKSPYGNHPEELNDENEALPNAERPRLLRRVLSDADHRWLPLFAAHKCGSHAVHRGPFPISDGLRRTSVPFSADRALRTVCMGVVGVALRTVR